MPEPAAARLADPLPASGHLSTRARTLKGPRVMTERTHGREIALFGSTRARNRVLVAGCANGTVCAGTGVVNATMIGCPPPDAELWLFATLEPGGADLDATPAHAGARAFRQAVADLRPTTVIVFRTGPRPLVRASGPSAAAGRRYARLARLPFTTHATQGLASWASLAAHTAAITVELPPRVSARRASRLAYAIDRLAGTRFARGAHEDRVRLIALGFDPRQTRH